MVKVLNEYKGTMEVTKEFYEMFRECLSTDEARYALNYVYFDSDQQTFVATDGSRMIWHISLDMSPKLTGFYELAKIGRKYKLIPFDCDGQFPSWQKVIPDREEAVTIKLDDGDCMMSLSGKMADDSVTLCQLIRATDSNINIDFLTKVLKHAASFTVQCSGRNKAILFEIDKDTNYIVMPLLRV